MVAGFHFSLPVSTSLSDTVSCDVPIEVVVGYSVVQVRSRHPKHSEWKKETQTTSRIRVATYLIAHTA